MRDLYPLKISSSGAFAKIPTGIGQPAYLYYKEIKLNKRNNFTGKAIPGLNFYA